MVDFPLHCEPVCTILDQNKRILSSSSKTTGSHLLCGSGLRRVQTGRKRDCVLRERTDHALRHHMISSVGHPTVRSCYGDFEVAVLNTVVVSAFQWGGGSACLHGHDSDKGDMLAVNIKSVVVWNTAATECSTFPSPSNDLLMHGPESLCAQLNQLSHGFKYMCTATPVIVCIQLKCLYCLICFF